MFTVRPYKKEDAAACGDCFYEGFFSCSVDQNDKILLRDYAQILIEKCNFTYVAETEDHQVVGFICGKYDKRFSKALAAQYETKKHYGRWCKMFLKFYLKRYKMSAPFQKQFDAFFRQLQERDKETVDIKCQHHSRSSLMPFSVSYRKGIRKPLGNAIWNSLPFRPEGITERGWEPHWSHNF